MPPTFSRYAFGLASFLSVAGCSSTTATPDGGSGSNGTTAGRYTSAPAMTIDTNKSYAATLTTSKGTIELSLDAKAAPVTVNNFVFLVRDKYYDGLKFHRVE